MTKTLYRHNQLSNNKGEIVKKSIEERIKELYYLTAPKGNEKIEQWLSKNKLQNLADLC